MQNPISLTESAARRLKEIISSTQDVIGARISVQPKGCMGLSYILELEYSTEIDPMIDNVIIEEKGVKLYIDKKAYDFLNGTTVDFIDEGLGSKFSFDNPNAKNRCSCGNSFCV